MENAEITKLRGRLNAHRELLIELTSLLLEERGRVPAGAQGGPGEDLSIYDQEEDPGVIPTDGFAEQAEFASEVRAIFDAARARMEAKSRKS
ncbi:hypothetical protein ABID16_003369 [Rhizobium aquaticum]|uniref:Uncharacterized protein n=1 Tax=Rhizobium aquaticum TaxID=1549636 RepID=A0ABV2J3Y8_9HYPH